MPMTTRFEPIEPTRAEIDATQGALVLEFGAPWCGYCQAAQPLIERAFAQHEATSHLKIEDGKGRPLGRSYGVKLWPTLVFLRDGQEVERLVRPNDAGLIDQALQRIAG
jgi:thioredoxin 1